MTGQLLVPDLSLCRVYVYARPCLISLHWLLDPRTEVSWILIAVETWDSGLFRMESDEEFLIEWYLITTILQGTGTASKA